MDMTKYKSADDPGYFSVSGELRRWVKALSQRPLAFGRHGETTGAYGGAPYPPGRESSRYPPYAEDVGGYPYGGPPRQPSPYGARGQGQSPYPQDAHQSPQQHQDPRLYPPNSWEKPQYSSPPPLVNSRYSPQDAYDQHRPPYSPNYQRYRSENGYPMAPPPPEPKYIEDAPQMSPPMPTHSTHPRWDPMPPPSPHGHTVYQGSNVVTNNGSQTFGNGKSVQGNNIHAGGNVSF